MTDMTAFEWSVDEVRSIGARVTATIARHVAERRHAPAFRPMPRDDAHALREAPVPLHGIGMDGVLDEFERDVEPFPFGNGGPCFFGWVNSPPALAGVFAEALASAMNPSVAGGNHAAVHVEYAVASWLTALVGLPATSKGILVSGASAAAIVALNAARYSACRRAGWDIRAHGLQPRPDGVSAPRLAVYRSGEGHGCHQKAVELLGLGADAFRTVATDSALRMVPSALDEMLAEDRRRGIVPMAVIASAGTVNTGAIDPIAEIAAVCRRHGVWLHVDGAYGAPAILSEAYHDALAELAHADSVALDPHKWLYAPVDAGFVSIRDAVVMRDAASLVPPYLRTDDDEAGVQGPPWFSEYGIEQTRPFRALKVWFCLKAIGLDGYRELIEHDIAMARYLASLIRADDRLEVWEPQSLSIVCFRLRSVNGTETANDTDLNVFNRALVQHIQLGGEAFVSSTTIGGRFWLRACVVNPRTTMADVDRLMDAVRAGIRAFGGDPMANLHQEPNR